MRIAVRLGIATLALGGMLAFAVPPAGAERAEREPLDLTGSTWDLAGRFNSSPAVWLGKGPAEMRMEFLPNDRYEATDPVHGTLTGCTEVRSRWGNRLDGDCDDLALDAIEAGIAEDIEDATGNKQRIMSMDHQVKLKLNRPGTRLNAKFRLAFIAEDLVTARMRRVNVKWSVRGRR
mgnify:CR=1 FL=1